MAIFIQKPWYAKKGANLDDYFDPITHIATESDFIRLLEDGVYTADAIGYKVQLANSADYNNGLWVIADVNHNSKSTQQTNYYDLISENVFYNAPYNNSGTSTSWSTSPIRNWVNNTFLTGFSNDFKSHMLNILNNDKITIPSRADLDGDTYSYPIFTDDNSRKKYLFNSSTYRYYWTKTPRSGYALIYTVNADGSFGNRTPESYAWISPLMRVH